MKFQSAPGGPAANSRNLLILLGLAVMLWAGCVPTSVEPAFRLSDIVDSSSLAGNWSEEKEDKTKGPIMTFEPLPSNQEEVKTSKTIYRLTVTEDGKKSEFTAVPFLLGTNLCLDLCGRRQTMKDAGLEGLYNISMIPGHLVTRVIQQNNKLALAFLDAEWLDKQLKARPRLLRHRIVEDCIVLTGSTSELQGFYRKHLTDTNVFRVGDFMTKAR